MFHRLFASESVTEGHADKIADQISDAILDELPRQGPASRVAVETPITTGLVHVAGAVTSKARADISALVRARIEDAIARTFDLCPVAVIRDLGPPRPVQARKADRPGCAVSHARA